MRRALLVLAMLCVFSFVSGCTDAERGKLGALGDSAHIECWSGGVKIFDGQSTGKVHSETSSDGYFFKNKKDGIFYEVSGNCVITYNDE